MKASVSWLNRLLERPLTAEAIELALIEAGFPIESKTAVTGPDGPDLQLDVEITSNRGDCLSHIGLAREVAAKTDSSLRPPVLAAPAPLNSAATSSAIALSNPPSSGCPHFSVRVIRGVTVGASPPWLRLALESVGQRSINNVVDVTNFISAELGNPCHVFDLAKLAGAQLNVRFAHSGEALTTLDGKKRTLSGDELVVADRDRAQSLAGVMGGADSEVSLSTTDVVLEMATWNPVLVRRASRRHGLRTDASHRFERLVDPRTIEAASARGAALIVEVAGGELLSGTVAAGLPMEPPMRVRLRPRRVRDILGVDVSPERLSTHLAALGIGVGPLGRAGDDLVALVPPHRPDITREIDLIEEYARLEGLPLIPVAERMSLRVKAPQASELARGTVSETLVGLGFFEAISFSFASREIAGMFMPQGMTAVAVDDTRRAHEPALRPAIIPGLLASRRHNQDGGVIRSGGVRLFETAAVFADTGEAGTETTNVAFLADVPFKGKTPTLSELQMGVRLARGVIETLIRSTRGNSVAIRVESRPPHCRGFRAGATAAVSVNGRELGVFGLISDEAVSAFGLTIPVVAGELNLAEIIADYPAPSALASLPGFPGIERDVSFIVQESVTYAMIEGGVTEAGARWLESCGFVGTYRGLQIGKGRKSVTLRLAFRDPTRTLTHDEVDGPARAVIDRLKAVLGAEVREV